MIKRYLYLFIFITLFCNGFITNSHAKDPFFIQQDSYDHWALTKTYNQIWLSNIKETNDFTIKIQPYDYSLRIDVFLKNIKNNPASIELDIGNFTCELKQEKDHIYKTVLEPINIVQFINELKKQQSFTLTINDQINYNVSLKGINKALDEMESFAQNHYIILPQPFSAKIDEFSTMNIPNIIPSSLYPLFRQQASLNQHCKSEKNDQKEKCLKEYQTILHLLKLNNICKQEKQQSSLSYQRPATQSIQWVNCSSNQ